MKKNIDTESVTKYILSQNRSIPSPFTSNLPERRIRVTNLYFNVRDIFRAARLGWSGKKTWIAFCGIAIAYIIHGILTYVALLAIPAGTFGELWDKYGLFPKAMPGQFSWLSWIIYVIGAVVALFIVLCTAEMICKIAYRQLKGDEFYSMGDSFKSLKRNWKAVILSPVFLFGMIVFFIICGIIIGGIARIPYVGEIGFAVLLIPIFFVSLLTVFLGVVLIFSLLLSPAIVGTTSEDTMETIIQLFSTVWSQPWRLFLYEIWLGVSVCLVTVILGLFTFHALLLINWACGIFMGQYLAGTMDAALQYIPGRLFFFFKNAPQYLQMQSFLEPITSDLRPTVSASGWISVIMLLGIIGFVYSYALATLSSGQALIYLVLRKKKDDENLLEKKDREEEEEERAREEEERERKEKEEEERKKREEEEKREEPEEVSEGERGESGEKEEEASGESS